VLPTANGVVHGAAGSARTIQATEIISGEQVIHSAVKKQSKFATVSTSLST